MLNAMKYLSTWQFWVGRPNPRRRSMADRKQYAQHGTWVHAQTVSEVCPSSAPRSCPCNSLHAGVLDVVRTGPVSRQATQTSLLTASDWSSWNSAYDTHQCAHLQTSSRSTCSLHNKRNSSKFNFIHNILTSSTPDVPNWCCSKCWAPYWSNPLFLIFDTRVLWRSVLSARAPECQKLKIVD